MISIPPGHELASLYIPYTTPFLLRNKMQPNEAMRDFMTTLSSVPICVEAEPNGCTDRFIIPTLVKGLTAELFFVGPNDTSFVAGGTF